MATKPHKTAATAPPAPPPQPAAVVGGNYTVGNTPILRDGVLHATGSVIELTPAQAQRLGLTPLTDDLE